MAELGPELVETVRAGYAFEGPGLRFGALVIEGRAYPDAAVGIPLSMLNRHGLIAGATGTGKTKTLQVMAEQCSAAGIPVFAADMKGDLSGLATAGERSEKVTSRSEEVGQNWTPAAYPVEFFALGGLGTGLPVRATITGFGPVLLAKVLDLNDVQTSSLGLVFHWADKAGLPMLDLKDLRAVVSHLASDEGKADLAALGGLSKSTAGVILRELIAFADAGAEPFFGEPEFEVDDVLRTAQDGRGIVSMLELPALQDRPAVFSTFLMWLLAELFEKLPEVGDVEKPKLVFFFDEAHLLFTDASKEFLATVAQTVRLIRSKGVGIFFVTQTPKDVPGDVLAQLGSRVQHALRAFTPEDAKALRATVTTFPKSAYDLEELLPQLGIGEAVITVLSERGAPTPVAWTRLAAPQSRMAPTDPDRLAEMAAASPLHSEYAEAVDRESAYEKLSSRLAPAEPAAGTPVPETPAPAPPAPEPEQSPIEKVVTSKAFKSFATAAAATLGREITRGIFGTARRKSRRRR